MSKRFRYVVMVNPVEGRDAELNDWYKNQHIADFKRIPGVVAVERFALSHHQREGAALPWKYMTTYDIETDDIDAVIHELKVRPGTPLMPRTDALLTEGRFQCFFEAVQD